MILECDARLSTATEISTGLPTDCYSEQEIQEMLDEDVYPAFFATEVGQRFSENYDVEASLPRIDREFGRRFGKKGVIGRDWPGVVFASRLVEIVNDLMRVGDPGLIRDEEEATADAPATERPRDARGKFLSDIAAEVRADIDNPTISTVEIKEKRRSSREYDAAFVKGTEMEITTRTVQISDELYAFADAYNASAASQLKFVNGLVTLNNDRKYSRSQFDDLVTRGSAAGLIR